MMIPPASTSLVYLLLRQILRMLTQRVGHGLLGGGPDAEQQAAERRGGDGDRDDLPSEVRGTTADADNPIAAAGGNPRSDNEPHRHRQANLAAYQESAASRPGLRTVTRISLAAAAHFSTWWVLTLSVTLIRTVWRSCPPREPLGGSAP
jgi:hypothetical protein